MHIGQHRHIQLVADVGQYLQTFVLARTAIRLTRAAVGLVERAFVDEGYAQLASHFLQDRSEEHTSELQSLMRISYAVFCLKKKKKLIVNNITYITLIQILIVVCSLT